LKKNGAGLDALKALRELSMATANKLKGAYISLKRYEGQGGTGECDLPVMRGACEGTKEQAPPG
jgi:hypothetical protein